MTHPTPTDHSQAHRARRERTDMSEQVEGEGLAEQEDRVTRIARGRAKHGVGSSEDFPGNVCHLVSPIVGWMRRRERDGKPLDDLAHTIERLSLVLDMANDEAERALEDSAAHAPEADGATGEREHMCPGAAYCNVCAGSDPGSRPATPDADDATTASEGQS